MRRKDNGKGREVSHDEYHEVRRRHQEKMQRPESEEQYKRRQHFGETAFAVMKACFDMRRFLLRGIEGFEPNFSGLHCLQFKETHHTCSPGARCWRPVGSNKRELTGLGGLRDLFSAQVCRPHIIQTHPPETGAKNFIFLAHPQLGRTTNSTSR